MTTADRIDLHALALFREGMLWPEGAGDAMALAAMRGEAPLPRCFVCGDSGIATAKNPCPSCGLHGERQRVGNENLIRTRDGSMISGAEIERREALPAAEHRALHTAWRALAVWVTLAALLLVGCASALAPVRQHHWYAGAPPSREELEQRGFYGWTLWVAYSGGGACGWYLGSERPEAMPRGCAGGRLESSALCDRPWWWRDGSGTLHGQGGRSPKKGARK